MLSGITETIESIILSMGAWAPILACFLILIESILPVLPLCAFITINFISFGSVIGFAMSWVFTCLGCFASYFLVKNGFRSLTDQALSNSKWYNKSIKYVNKLSLSSFTVILAIPFTPAFMMNIAAGLAKMPFKKFLISVLISKIFMVYFWGYIGVGLVESFQNPYILIKVVLMVAIAFVISKIVNYSLKEDKMN